MIGWKMAGEIWCHIFANEASRQISDFVLYKVKLTMKWPIYDTNPDMSNLFVVFHCHYVDYKTTLSSKLVTYTGIWFASDTQHNVTT